MGNLKSFGSRFGPVSVLSLAIMGFANSSVTVAREAGYVPIVITPTGTTTTMLVSSSSPYGRTKHRPKAPRPVKTAVKAAEASRVAAAAGAHPISDDDNLSGTPQYQLAVNKWFPFQVRYRRHDENGNNLSGPDVIWYPELHNSSGAVVTVNIHTLINWKNPDDQYEEQGQVMLLSDGNYSTQPGNYILLRARLIHNSGINQGDDYSYRHDSVRLYWQTPPPDSGTVATTEAIAVPVRMSAPKLIVHPLRHTRHTRRRRRHHIRSRKRLHTRAKHKG
jgi:hypothetical protein